MRRGQVTVFIIIGILVLLAFGLAIIVKNVLQDDRPRTTTVPEEAKPISSLVETCLAGTLKDGILRIGQQGGVLELINIRVSPYGDSEGLVLLPNVLPYWHYASNGAPATKKPPLCENRCVIVGDTGRKSVEEQIARHIEETLPACLDDFENIEAFDIASEEPEARVFITETGVGAELDMPVTAKTQDSTITLKSFTAAQNVRLAEAWLIATNITNLERQTGMFEEIALHIMEPYQGVDNHLPPTKETSVGFTKHYWFLPQVKERLDEDVLPYLDLVQFVNAPNARALVSNEEGPYAPYANGVLSYLYVKTREEPYELETSLRYVPGVLFLDFGQGYVLRPKDLTGSDPMTLLTGIALQDYTFKYTMRFPLVLSITDPEAFNGEGWTLNVAYQANIVNNQPLTAETRSVTNIGSPYVAVDDPGARPEREYTLHARDKLSGETLDDVSFEYACGETTTLGETREGLLKTTLPYCATGGELRWYRQGYQGGGMALDNPDGEGSEAITAELWPIHQLAVSVYKRTEGDVDNITGVSTGALTLLPRFKTMLDENDTMLVSVAKDTSDAYEEQTPLVGFVLLTNEPFQAPIDNARRNIENAFNAGQISADDRDTLLAALEEAPPEPVEASRNTMGLVPGRYNVSVTLLSRDGLHLARKTEEVCVNSIPVVGCVDHETVEYPVVNESIWISGGSVTQVTLTPEELYGSRSLVTYALEQAIPQDWDEFKAATALEDYLTENAWMAQPTIE